MNEERDYRGWIRWVQEKFRASLGKDFLVDLCFIGNTADVDRWEPAPIVDLDVCLFVREIGLELGNWLLTVRADSAAYFAAQDILFDLKIIRGPHKPAVETVVQPQITAHLAVFTPETYQQTPSSLRWAWRKYRCEIEPDRLARGGGEPMNREELSEMIARKLGRLEAGVIKMNEWVLPAFEMILHQFSPDHPAFPEYCLMGSMVVARSHARLLGHPEADLLSNEDFTGWYVQACAPIPALMEIWALKRQARQQGFGGLMPKARELAIEFLTLLQTHI